MNNNPLLVSSQPWVLASDVESAAFKHSLDEFRANGGKIIVLDGARTHTSEALFDEFAQAASFPDYFGRNWPALDECLADLEWLPAEGYVIILRNPAQLLDAEPSDRAVFARVIRRVASEWAEAVALGEYWDRPSTPFHLVADYGPQSDTSGELRSLTANDAFAWLDGRNEGARPQSP